MPYDAKPVANFFLDLAASEGKSLTPMKLQKLVYYAHGWNLGLTGEPLLDEQVQAWSFGPVIRSIYNEFREFGADEITSRALDAIPAGGMKYVFRTSSLDDSPDTVPVKNLLNRVWEVYGKFSATQLSNMTHAPGTPWDRVNKQYGGQMPKYTTIPQDWIADYFRAKGSAP